jgi:hypothetical protein
MTFQQLLEAQKIDLQKLLNTEVGTPKFVGRPCIRVEIAEGETEIRISL